MRKTYASNAAQKRFPRPRTIMRYLRHSDLEHDIGLLGDEDDDATDKAIG